MIVIVIKTKMIMMITTIFVIFNCIVPPCIKFITLNFLSASHLMLTGMTIEDRCYYSILR